MLAELRVILRILDLSSYRSISNIKGMIYDETRVVVRHNVWLR